jgi:hypothetical protein
MKYSTRLRSIRDVKAEETLALLKILALGRRQVEEGKTLPVDEAFRRLRDRRSQRG